MEKKYGTVASLKTRDGYGFIKPDSERKYIDNIFFHISGLVHPQCIEELKIGDRVEYCEVETFKGKKAVDIVVI